MRGKNKWKSYKRIFNESSPSPYSPVPHALGEGHTEHFKLLFPYLSVDTFYFTFLKQVYFYPGTHAVLFPSLFLVEPSRKTLYLSLDDPCLSVRTGLSIACASWRLSFFFIIIFFIFYFFWHLCWWASCCLQSCCPGSLMMGSVPPSLLQIMLSLPCPVHATCVRQTARVALNVW